MTARLVVLLLATLTACRPTQPESVVAHAKRLAGPGAIACGAYSAGADIIGGWKCAFWQDNQDRKSYWFALQRNTPAGNSWSAAVLTRQNQTYILTELPDGQVASEPCPGHISLDGYRPGLFHVTCNRLSPNSSFKSKPLRGST